MEWREKNGVRWLEADLGGARAAFSTRLGGVSEAPYDSLNLGLLTEDAVEAVAENRNRLAATLGFAPEQVVFARQVHGTDLLHHPREGGVAEADGHIVREPGLVPLVFVADCLPVALYGPRGLAMVHAGWRPLAGGILAAGKGQANTQRGARRFLDELIARVRCAGATGPLTVRVDAGFWSRDTITTLNRLDVRYTMSVRTSVTAVAAAIATIDDGRLGRHRLPRRRTGAGRRVRLHLRSRQATGDAPDGRAPHPAHRQRPTTAVA